MSTSTTKAVLLSQLSIPAVLKTTWSNLFSAHFALVLAAVFIPQVILFAIQLADQMTGLVLAVLSTSNNAYRTTFMVIAVLFSIGFLLIQVVLQNIMYIGATKIQLDVVDSRNPRLKQLFQNMGIFWPYLWTSILYGLLVVFGLILFVLPGIYWAMRYLFAPTVMVDKKLTIKRAFARSSELTNGHKWWLLGFSLVVLGLNIIGFICFIIGLVVTIPLTSLAYIQIYRYLSKSTQLA